MTAKETPMHVSQMLEQIHARMQVKLARQGMSPDRKSLRGGLGPYMASHTE